MMAKKNPGMWRTNGFLVCLSVVFLILYQMQLVCASFSASKWKLISFSFFCFSFNLRFRRIVFVLNNDSVRLIFHSTLNWLGNTKNKKKKFTNLRFTKNLTFFAYGFSLIKLECFVVCNALITHGRFTY